MPDDVFESTPPVSTFDSTFDTVDGVQTYTPDSGSSRMITVESVGTNTGNVAFSFGTRQLAAVAPVIAADSAGGSRRFFMSQGTVLRFRAVPSSDGFTSLRAITDAASLNDVTLRITFS